MLAHFRCTCSVATGSSPGGTDSMTFVLTAADPQYVTDFQLTTHNANAVGTGYLVNVGSISCCETYTP